jgi:hypothetical protein
MFAGGERAVGKRGINERKKVEKREALGAGKSSKVLSSCLNTVLQSGSHDLQEDNLQREGKYAITRRGRRKRWQRSARCQKCECRRRHLFLGGTAPLLLAPLSRQLAMAWASQGCLWARRGPSPGHMPNARPISRRHLPSRDWIAQQKSRTSSCSGSLTLLSTTSGVRLRGYPMLRPKSCRCLESLCQKAAAETRPSLAMVTCFKFPNAILPCRDAKPGFDGGVPNRPPFAGSSPLSQTRGRLHGDPRRSSPADLLQNRITPNFRKLQNLDFSRYRVFP